MFTPSIMDGAFSMWLEHGIRSMYDLFCGNVFTTFEQLVQMSFLELTLIDGSAASKLYCL